jgi:hypothetical protein
MNKDDIQLLYEYDRWADNRVLQAVSELNAELLTHDLACSFRSVRDTLVHIIGGEWIWLAYWNEPSPSGCLHHRLEKATGCPVQSAFISPRGCGTVKVGGGRERTGRVRKSRDKRILEKMVPFAHRNSVWRTRCNIWRTIPLTIEVKSQ